MNYAEVQRALVKAGFSVGRAGVDGIWGRDSITGLKAFQRARNLPVTGVLDHETVVKLFPTGASMPVPPWFAEAGRLMGTREIVGPKNSSIIMGWAKKLGLWYPNDEMAWCGLFVAHCIALTMPDEPLPANPLGAREWSKLGVPLLSPSPGAVMVFWRGSKSGWQGHVGFYNGENKTHFKVRGGNQSNSVSDAWIEKTRLLEIRWPKTSPLPTAGPLYLAESGRSSTNEA